MVELRNYPFSEFDIYVFFRQSYSSWLWQQLNECVTTEYILWIKIYRMSENQLLPTKKKHRDLIYIWLSH